MAQKKDPSQIYKWLAATLTLFVAGYILFLLSRQAIIDKRLADLTHQSSLPAASPSPRPSPKYTTPKGTENWNVYEHPQQNFTLRFPKDMSIHREGEKSVGFYKGDNQYQPDFAFGAGLTDLSGFDIAGITMGLTERLQFMKDLFSKQDGVVADKKSDGLGYTVVKKNTLKKNSVLQVIHVNIAFTSTSTQQPSQSMSLYLFKVGETYYSLVQGYTSQNNIEKYKATLDLAAQSFTAF
jgi:hypothetical protein